MPQTGKKAQSKAAGGTPERKLLIRGLAASPGLAEGKVVLVPGSAEAMKISEGDILVATMTTPDMIPALRKAGAVVTDEGGRTCHAAILSVNLASPASSEPAKPRRYSPRGSTSSWTPHGASYSRGKSMPRHGLNQPPRLRQPVPLRRMSHLRVPPQRRHLRRALPPPRSSSTSKVPHRWSGALIFPQTV